MLFTGQMVVGASLLVLKIWSVSLRKRGGKLSAIEEYKRSVGEPAEGSLVN